MANGRKKRSAKKKARAKKGTRKERTAATLKIIKQRLSLHEHQASLPDFKGGKLPVRSGCGRPRLKK